MIVEPLILSSSVVRHGAQGQCTQVAGTIVQTNCIRKLGFVSILMVMVAAVLLLRPTEEALANDGIINRTAAGGITFVKNDHIRIQEELLEISTQEVRVKFRFFNDSAHDIRATVGFAAPPYGPGEARYPSNISASFRVLINGRPVSPEFVRRAIVGDSDVTTQLLEAGLSDGPIYGDSRLSENQRSALERLDGAKGKLLRNGFKEWKIAVTAFWQQDFPSRKEVVIQHTYKPAVGHVPISVSYDADRGVYVPDLSSPESIPTAHGEKDKDVCLDDISRDAIKKKIKAYKKAYAGEGGLSICVYLRHIEYVLSTGRKWKGPIGKFKLRIEKDAQDQIISLCFPGKPKKISSTAYEFVHKDFVPPDRLIVYFYDIGGFPDEPL